MLCGMWDLPGPGLEPASPALAGGFLTTVPPGKSLDSFSCWHLHLSVTHDASKPFLTPLVSLIAHLQSIAKYSQLHFIPFPSHIQTSTVFHLGMTRTSCWVSQLLCFAHWILPLHRYQSDLPKTHPSPLSFPGYTFLWFPTI